MKQHSETVAVSVSGTPWGGYGLVAKKAVEVGDVILRLEEVRVVGNCHRQSAAFRLETALSNPQFGKLFTLYLERGMPGELLTVTALLYERFENERWSDFAAYLSLLPSVEELQHPVLLEEDTALALYGSRVLEQLRALNATIRLNYVKVRSMLENETRLRRLFLKSQLFTFERFRVVVWRE